MTEHHNSIHTAMDVAAPVSVLGAIAGWLPPIAAALGIIWYCVLLYDRFCGKKK
jgi:hypothetical protein